ncbi:hypothetical protein HELRODRAFT_191365 [Helobdella robusta]|uniref:Uncharacterized protein n=1 Tax=Helobdella robusta TaxID=6412 RepID=T1FSX3_HELRO|nr:hypothetical protein HELRODRAFT_191365 [Helobdella robusta]ESO05726.1 hypothetical protein HELRODRAFT_191365 [Helobdella robusta]
MCWVWIFLSYLNPVTAKQHQGLLSNSSGLFKPKNPHSLDHLKYLYGILCKNQTVTEGNLGLLVETLRSISEILIWGDQNDSTVFDFFLEKNMLVFFLKFMKQKSGQCICVQLLQTLNILFDNITNETSVYYLLSNNHINSIIVHKFDFSDEEVMAYYISFLKTLSMKLNKHTVHFFYNEHTNDFALYTEAIKFFNHSESMVRIAVRTITLNVYRACVPLSKMNENSENCLAEDRSMLQYIKEKTASPYFINLVKFIGNHIIDLHNCVTQDNDKLKDAVAIFIPFSIAKTAMYVIKTICFLSNVAIEIASNQDCFRFCAADVNPSTLEHFCDFHAAAIISGGPSLSLKSTQGSVDAVLCHTQDHLVYHNSKGKLSDLIAEHLDHLHYINDILCLEIEALNEVLTEHLLNQLFIPLYIHSLLPGHDDEAFNAAAAAHSRFAAKKTSSDTASDVIQDNCIVSLFLISQLFLIIHHGPLVTELVRIIFMKDIDDGFTQEILKKKDDDDKTLNSTTADNQACGSKMKSNEVITDTNSTDEEKLMRCINNSSITLQPLKIPARPYLTMILSSLRCSRDDYQALLALCLIYSLKLNTGVDQNMLDSIQIPLQESTSAVFQSFNVVVIQHLINIMSLSCQNASKIRLVTLELSIMLLKVMCVSGLDDEYIAAVEGIKEGSTLMLRNFYKSEEIFLDMFEDEHRELTTHPLNVDHLMMDACILLPPIGTPLTGIDFCKRLPCGEVERARRAIRFFFLVRSLSYYLRREEDTSLPLTKENECVHFDDVLDLNNSDLIACTVIHNESKKERRFLVIDTLQLILVEPDSKKLGWGLVRFTGFLQDTEVTSDKEDSRCLQVTIHKPSSNTNVRTRPLPILSAKFLFDDHIRCMAARQRLTKGRLKARQKKMQMIAKVLDMPAHLVDSMYAGSTLSSITRMNLAPSSSSSPSLLGSPHFPGQAHRRKTREIDDDPQSVNTNNKSPPSIKQSIFASVDKVPAFNSVASEQEHERRARRLKAKLTDSIARQQQLAKTLLSSSSNTNDNLNLVMSTPESKKKMFLSMAKEAKQRSMQQNKKLEQPQCSGGVTDFQSTKSGSTVFDYNNPSESKLLNEAKKSCLKESLSSSSALSSAHRDLEKANKVGSLDSKIEARSAVAESCQNMVRASSETRSVRVKDEERRNSGPPSNLFNLSRSPKEKFASWINPIIYRTTSTQEETTPPEETISKEPVAETHGDKK